MSRIYEVMPVPASGSLLIEKGDVLDIDPTTAQAIKSLRNAVAAILKFPEYASPLKPELTRLVDVIEEWEETAKLKASADSIGFKLRPSDTDTTETTVNESFATISKTYDCVGRPRFREVLGDDSQRFANRLR